MFRKNIAKWTFATLAVLCFCVIFSSCVSQPKAPEKSAEVVFVEKLQAALENGTIEEALLLFENMPAKLQKDYDINYLHAALLISANRLDEAEEVVAILDKIDAENPENLVIKSVIAKAKGETKQRSALLKEIVKKDPTNSDACVELGNDQLLNKRYKVALSYFEKAVKSDDSNISAYLGYGQCLYYMDRLDESKKAFERMLEINPKSAIAWSYLAKLEFEKENYAEAYTKMQKAVEYDSGYADYWIDLGRCNYYLGKFSEAEECWNKACSLDSQNFLIYVYRSSLYDEVGKYDLAIQDYKKIIELKPSYYYAYEALGILYWHTQDYEAARENFLKAYSVNPNNISYALMTSACYIKEKREADNKKFMQTTLKNRDTKSVEYSVLRLYYDGVNMHAVDTKVRNEQNPGMRGKYLFYLGLYSELRGDDLGSKTYYNEVTKMQAPMFFEYRLAEWSLNVAN